jgi:hypothetical protein
VIEGLNGSTMAGRLMNFNPAAGLAHVQVSASRTTLPLRFSQFRCLRLATPMQPLPFDPTDTTPLALTECRAEPYRVQLQGGAVLEGRTITHEENAHGLFLFEPVDDNGAVRRCFVPRAVYSHVDIGRRLGEALVEQRAATAEQVDAALEVQHKLRNQKLGEILLVKQLISPDELEAAIEEQSRMPMVRIGQALTALGFITEAQLEQALQQQQQDRGVPLGELLVRDGHITRADLQTALARKMGYPLVDVVNFPVELEALQRLPYAVASRLPALPLMMRGGRLVVALEDPTQRKAIDEIEFAARCKSIPVLARSRTLYGTIDRAYEKLGVEVNGAGGGPEQPLEFDTEQAGKLLATLEQEGDSGPEGDDAAVIEQSDNSLVRLINTMILEAQSQGVSDIHIETMRPGARRCACASARTARCGPTWSCRHLPQRAGGAHQDHVRPGHQPNAASRRTARSPSQVRAGHRSSNCAWPPSPPTTTAKTWCCGCWRRPSRCRWTSSTSARPTWNAAGRGRRPYGMILCVGPTGSGKTTTLHSAMGYINTPERKIWTAEDPIEITQQGCARCRSTRRSTGPSPRRCAPSCAPTPT